MAPTRSGMLPHTWSISLRLAAWFTLVIAIFLTGFAALTYVNFHLSLHRDFDQHLAHELRVLRPEIENGDQGPYFPNFEGLQAVAYQSDGIYGTFVRLSDLEGRLLYSSPNFEGHQILDMRIPSSAGPRTISREWAEGPIRSLYHRLLDPNGEPFGWVEVTGYEWSLHTELDRLTRTFTVGILLAVLLSAGGGFLLARRALSPVADITEATNRIRTANLSERIPLHDGPEDELSQLTQTINGLLDRIEESFRRERRFSANAAHELVTPLATMRAEMELALRTLDDQDHMEGTLVATLADIDQMSQIVRSLLMLSSAERMSEGPRDRLDLGVFGKHQVERFRDRADLREISLELRNASPVWVTVDKKGLATVFDNLVDNALKYSPSGGSIVINIGGRNDEAQLTISDDGIGFAPEAGVHLFDRFYRENAASVQQRDGSGLGLSIVAAIVSAHGGRVWGVSDGPGLGSTFGVAIPVT
jgi:signal transduction histidine kinase